MADYDIGAAFEAIEEELIDSMMRNLSRHRAEEKEEGINWTQWQAEQLKYLEQYKKANQKKYAGKFRDINKQIDKALREAKQHGGTEQEQEILNAIKNGFKGFKRSSAAGMTGEFFKLNERKLEALINATTNDMKRAETAILRMSNDQYRKAIYNAQVYANTGAGTYEKAVDMATKDMLYSGLNCIEYANGARHTLSDYADMAIRTASKRAYLQGEGEMRQEWGVTTVIMDKRLNPCPLCLPWVGKVLIDDVWSGGSKDGKSPVTGLKYPLMSTAIEGGLYHPRCKDSHTTYFEGISTPPTGSKYTRDELDQLAEQQKQEARQQYAARQEKKYSRMERYSLDPFNRQVYGARAEEWKNVRFRTGNMTSEEYAQSKRPLGNFRATPQEQVVNVLREDSGEWIQKLSEIEKHAIRKYSYNPGDKKPNRFFERLNAMLRKDLPEDKKLKEYADIISGALAKNKLKRDVICYRGSSVNPVQGFKVGEIVSLGQFISTSVIPEKALSGECKITIYAKRGTCGAYIEKLSEYPKQRELLLDKSCTYRVLLNRENEVELEVL
jgi:hypothetical protein